MFFRSTSDIMAACLADFKSITGQDLKITDINRPEVVKMLTDAGAISSFYAALQLAYDNFFPESASEDALELHLAARELPGRIQPQPSNGSLTITGTAGTAGVAGTQFSNSQNANIYVALTDWTIPAGGSVDVNCQSLVKGQDQNIDDTGISFTLVTAITGVSSVVNSTQFRDGRDLETGAEMLVRIQDYDQNSDTGGNLEAYERFAKEASDQVVTATAIKNPRGAGTVNTVITSGTTDIDGAVDAGLPITRLPSSDLLATVQAYIIDKNPTTDDHQTIGPTESAFAVTFQYNLFDETLRSSVDPVITKIIQKYVYKAQSGETLDPTDLERLVDQSVGHLIKSRRCGNFGGSAHSFTVPSSEILTPGTITLGTY